MRTILIDRLPFTFLALLLDGLGLLAGLVALLQIQST